ncbi:MAG TPA: hypothetical protein VGQ11_06810 [Candidatus Acidoferrales bacterium]|nr:hypothetical protein [Candidatus Acidoferrales bacterium]
MKRMVLMLAVVVAAGLLVASSVAQVQTKTSNVPAAVVSADKDAKTITFKTDDGKQWTLSAEGAAVKALEEVKAGDRVELTCRLTELGDYQAVTAIAKVKPKGEKP